MSADALFSILARASPQNDSGKYRIGKRYELIVFVREQSIDQAKKAFGKIIQDAGWEFPEVMEIAQVSDKMRMEKAKKIGLADAMRAAAHRGSAIVVFKET